MSKRSLPVRIFSLLLAAVISASQLSFAALPLRDPGDVRGGVYTASDGTEYAVLYNSYITLYVNKDTSGFAVLPAKEKFDDTKPLSYASFQIGGNTYRYGANYPGISGIVSFEPAVNEQNLIEANWQIEDIVITQVFAITQETEHENSYAVKVGYSARNYGASSARIAGRIVLDTQFTPDESIPVMLGDKNDNMVLVESEAVIAPPPSVAIINDVFIEEVNLQAQSYTPEEPEDDIDDTEDTEENNGQPNTPVTYKNMPNKGYIAFADSSFTTPDAVMFADFGSAHRSEFNYTPSGAKLFDGSGADSAAILYWNETNLKSGELIVYGTIYGFYDLEKGNPKFAPVPEAEITDFSSIIEESGFATVNIWNVSHYIPANWFDIKSSAVFTEQSDEYMRWMESIAIKGVSLQICLDYKANTPQIIKDTVKKYRIDIHWDDGWDTWNISEELDIGQYYFLDTEEAFSHRHMVEDADGNMVPADLSINIEPTVQAPAGYAMVETGLMGAHDGAKFKLEGVGADASNVVHYMDNFSGTMDSMYIVKQGAWVRYSLAMADMGYIPDNTQSWIWWDEYHLGDNPEPEPDDLTGPINYTYTFTVPSEAKGGIYIFIDSTGSVPQPINIRAFHSSYTPPQIIVAENAIWHATGGTDLAKDMGILWAQPGTVVSINESMLSELDLSGSGSLNVYNAGTKTAPGGITNPITTGSFTMPNRPIDLVYENGTVYRVFAEVTGGGTANVSINSLHNNGVTPQLGEQVFIYVTNIEDGYVIKNVTAAGGITPQPQPGGMWTFTMPNSDVTVTVELEDTGNNNPFHNISVLPMASDGETYYDVMLWTDNISGARSPAMVDEAGRIGAIREGTTVYYAVYPTRWSGDINNWIISGFTINGEEVTDFDGINTGEAGEPGEDIGYFPYGYNPDNATATAGTFTMPAEDVVIELSGYHSERTVAMKVEAYAPDGSRLLEVEQKIRSTPTGAQYYWADGTADLPVGRDAHIGMMKQIHIYEIDKVYVEKHGITYDITNTHWYTSGNVAYYTVEQGIIKDSTLKIMYREAARTLTFFGWEAEGVQVYPYNGPYVTNVSTRVLTIMPDENGKYTARVKISWPLGYDAAYEYSVYDFDGGTATKVSSTNVDAVYDITLTKDSARAGIYRSEVANRPNFYMIKLNTANSTLFSDVIVNTYSSGAPQNLQKMLTQDPATRLTKITFSGAGTEYIAEAEAGGSLISDTRYSGVFTFPSSVDRGAYIERVEQGSHMNIDIRRLFGIAQGTAIADGRYTLSIEYSYGPDWKWSDNQVYTMNIGSDYFSQGDLRHIAIVQDSSKNWQIIPGISYNDMMSKARDVNRAGPLITLYNEQGFSYNRTTGEYSSFGGLKTVIMNGHAYFKQREGYSATFTITEKDGSVTVKSNWMSLGSEKIPAYVPHWIFNYPASSLTMEIEKGKDYIIPSRYPQYETDSQGRHEEQAREVWLEQYYDMQSRMIQIKPDYGYNDQYYGTGEFKNGAISIAMDDVEMSVNGGLTLNVREMYLTSNGFDIGGLINIQIPYVDNPVARIEVVSLLTDNTAKVIPADQIWAEGEVNLMLPVWLPLGAEAYGVFNTYTQDFGFDVHVNLWIIEFEGTLYLARSELLNIPFLDKIEVYLGFDAVFAGIGIPPAPAQIVEIKGGRLGLDNITSLIDWNMQGNTMPKIRLVGGLTLGFVEILEFDVAVTVGIGYFGFALDGRISVGPINLPFVDLSGEMGVTDGPFEPFIEGESVLWMRGNASVLLFINLQCRASLLGVADGELGIYASVSHGFDYLRFKYGFKSYEDFVTFLRLNVKAGGHLRATALSLIEGFSVGEALGTVDLHIGPGPDAIIAPIWPKVFEVRGEVKFLGLKVGEAKYDFMTIFNRLYEWQRDEFDKMLEEMERLREEYGRKSGSGLLRPMSEGIDEELQLMTDIMMNPGAYGLTPDEDYEGEFEYLIFGDTVADSTQRGIPATPGTNVAVPEQRNNTVDYSENAMIESSSEAIETPMMSMLSLTQDTTNIKIDYDGTIFTHTITVPDDGNDYWLQMEGFGTEQLTGADIRVFKPNGQALTVRQIPAEGATAAQAESGYNAAVIDGLLTLSLADFKNDDGSGDVTGVIGTLPGVWQVTSDRLFKSVLTQLNKLPTVSEVTLGSDGKLDIAFENVTVNSDYYYDVTLERKGDPNAAPLGIPLTIVNNQQVTSTSTSIDLKAIEYQGNGQMETYDIARIADSGDWYAVVTLRQGGMESFTQTDADGTAQTASMLVTYYLDSRTSPTAYTVKNWLESHAWTGAGLTAAAGGNQTINVTFNPANAPNSDMVTVGYSLTVYDSDGSIAAQRVTDTGGNQSVIPMEYEIFTSADGEPDKYEQSISNVSPGTYTVGVSPMYSDLIPRTDDAGNVIAGEYTASLVIRTGAEIKSPAVTVVEANPPQISYSVAGGNIAEENGSKFIFAGPDAELTAQTSDGSPVTYREFDGTVIHNGNTLSDLRNYAGQIIIISAQNSQGDRTTEFVSILEADMPLLVPDNFDESKETFVFTAFSDTGAFAVTGMTDTGATIEGAVIGDDGRFTLSGALEGGIDEADMLIFAVNDAGLTTAREVKIIRGEQADPGEEPGLNPGEEPGLNPGEEPGLNPGEEPGRTPSRTNIPQTGYYDDNDYKGIVMLILSGICIMMGLGVMIKGEKVNIGNTANHNGRSSGRFNNGSNHSIFKRIRIRKK